MTLSLPKEKLVKLETVLEYFNRRKKATKLDLQRLAGVLSQCTTLIIDRGGRTFSRRVIKLCKAGDTLARSVLQVLQH